MINPYKLNSKHSQAKCNSANTAVNWSGPTTIAVFKLWIFLCLDGRRVAGDGKLSRRKGSLRSTTLNYSSFLYDKYVTKRNECPDSF